MPISAPRLTDPTGHVVAIAVVALATLARWLLDPALGDHLPFVTYFVAILLVAWLTSLWPSVNALLLGAGAAYFFFIPPRYLWAFHLGGSASQFGMALYFMVGVAAIAVCEAMRAAERRT